MRGEYIHTFGIKVQTTFRQQKDNLIYIYFFTHTHKSVLLLCTKMEKEAPKTGTTIVACEYADGIVVGADTRVSTGTFCCCCCCVSRDFLSRRRAPFYFTFFVQVRLLFCRDLIIIIGLFTLSRNNNNNNNNNRDVHFQPRVG